MKIYTPEEVISLIDAGDTDNVFLHLSDICKLFNLDHELIRNCMISKKTVGYANNGRIMVNFKDALYLCANCGKH